MSELRDIALAELYKTQSRLYTDLMDNHLKALDEMIQQVDSQELAARVRDWVSARIQDQKDKTGNIPHWSKSRQTTDG